MKALRLLIILIGISSQVFAGYYLEFKLSGSAQGFSGTMKAWNEGGNSRSEMLMDMAQAGGMNMNMATLVLSSAPGKMYMLNEKSKTYSEMDVSKSEDFKQKDASEYEITVIGKEKVNGYNATHVKIKRKGEKGEMDWWTSTEVSGYNEMQQIQVKYLNEVNLYKALAAKGALGFPVRMKVNEQGNGMTMDLVKAEKTTIPASKFSLTGYTKGSAVPGMPANFDPEKMKNMSPAEQQKMLEDLMKQYQNK